MVENDNTKLDMIYTDNSKLFLQSTNKCPKYSQINPDNPTEVYSSFACRKHCKSYIRLAEI